MDFENKEQVEEKQPEQEILPPDDEETDLDAVMPKLQVTVPQQKDGEDISNLIEDDQLLGLYQEIVQNCRDDRKQTDDLLTNFVDMVINEGEASNAAKEAIPSLMKVKTEINDKMAKIADLMTRIKLKERDTFPKYLAAHQNNTINISSSKRDLLKAIEKKQKQIKGK
jgi:hypothetical protein